MGDPDIYISNGTCFYAAGKQSDDAFLPCGNSAFGHVHCCTAGEVCLDEKACYSDNYGTTYLAGCSDPDYKDESCPDKKAYHDYPWAGLIYCKPNQWVACKETSRPSTITRGDPCTCPPAPAAPTAAFTTGSVITRIGRLPGTLGGAIEWENGHFPTSPTSAPTSSHTTSESVSSSSFTSTTTAASTSTSTTTSSDSPLATNEAPPSPTHTLSTGAKAGIGIGAVFGAMILLGALSALWVVFRRWLNSKNKDDDSPEAGQELQGGPVGLGLDNLGSGRGGDGKHMSAGPVELPSPSVPVVPPRPEYAGNVGPWTVKPEVVPMGGGYGQGWQGPSQAWEAAGGGMAGVSGEGEREAGMGQGGGYGYGHGYDHTHDQGYDQNHSQAHAYGHDQGYGQGVSGPRGGERPQQGGVVELPG